MSHPHQNPDSHFDLFLYPGEHDGRPWEILLPVCVEDGAVTLEEVGIHAGTDDGGFDWRAGLDGDGADVPAPVLVAAKALLEATEALDLPSLGAGAPSP